MPTTVLTPVVEGCIWFFERPLWYSGVRLRARTTVVRLEDGGLLLHSPAPPTGELVAALRELGPVRWLVVPNAFHHLGTPAAAASWPEAKVVGPASVLRKNPGLRIDVDLAEGALGAEVPEMQALPLRGIPFLDETVLYHRPTQTLLGTDIVLSACAADHWTWRVASRFMGCYERSRVPPEVKKEIADVGAASRSLGAIVALPAQRLLVAHADVIVSDCCERLAAAWRLEGVEV